MRFLSFFYSYSALKNVKTLNKEKEKRARRKKDGPNFLFFLSALGILTLSRNTLREREREQKKRFIIKAREYLNGGAQRKR